MTKHAAEKSLDIQNRLFQEYQDAYYKTKDLPLALKKLEELLEITSLKQFVSYLIVDVYTQMGKPAEEAYEIANKGIQYPYPFSGLYKQHAELVLENGSSKNDLETALSSINEAIRLYNQESSNENIDDIVRNADSLKYWFENKTKTRMEMANLQSDIKILYIAELCMMECNRLIAKWKKIYSR